MQRTWGKILVSTRLEKMVSARFFQVWTALLQNGLRKGDGAVSISGHVAHKAQNECVRQLLRGNWDTLLSLDSDADVTPDFLTQFREYEAGQEYDILQAFYVRRGWPPRAIWLKRNSLGQMMEYFIRNPDCVSDVDIAGTHACLIRRAVFESMLGDADPATFEWFWYPRHCETSEDGAFSEAAAAAGFRIGATTAVRAGHICEIVTSWDTYQDYIRITGRTPLLDRYEWLARQIAEFTGETTEHVIARSSEGIDALRSAWRQANPQSAFEERLFYQTVGAENYLYELLAWNCQPFYQRLLDGMNTIRDCNVLVIGSGLGTEAEHLLNQGCSVTCYDLPGKLREFAQRRLGNGVQWTTDLAFVGSFDAVVALDTLEHIHPDEIGEMLADIGRAIAPGGRLYAHNNWAQQDSYPMHHDHGATFGAWITTQRLTKTGDHLWSR